MAFQPVSELLVRWRAVDREAPEKLVPLVYKELREIAHYNLQRERLGHTLKSARLLNLPVNSCGEWRVARLGVPSRSRGT